MNFSAKSRFTSIMVVTASVAMLLVGAIAWFEARKSLEDAEFTHLTSIRVSKSRQIEEYFQSMRDQLALMSQDQTLITSMVHLARGFRLLGENTVPSNYDTAIEHYYQKEFIPALDDNLANNAPEVSAFIPKSQQSRYLQYHYLSNKPTLKDGAENHDVMDALDGSEYSAYHRTYHQGLRDFLIKFGYYDIFLIDFDNGDIVYSVAKEVDFGTNLLTGPYRSTGLAEVVRMVMEKPIRNEVKIVDFTAYAPSYNAPASFMATPIYNGKHVVGILAFQIPVDKIQNIMTGHKKWRDEGMGESGETYIIGSDYLMRTDSRFLLENKDAYFDKIRGMGIKNEIINLIDKLDTTILLQPVRTEGARAALRGEQGYFLADDYRGVEVLSSYGKLNIEGLDWGIVSEIDRDEAFLPIGRLLRRILISTAIFIPIVAYLSFLLSQGFMNPIQHLTQIAKDMRKKYQSNDHEAGDALRFETNGASEYQAFSDEMNSILESTRKDMADTRQKKREYTDLITRNLPLSVSERFHSGETNITDTAKLATAILIHIDNVDTSFEHSNLASTLAMQKRLNTKIHDIAEQHGIDLFKQVSSEFLGVCGLTMPYLNHFERAMDFSVDIFAAVNTFNNQYSQNNVVTIGMDIGSIFGALEVEGIINYDIIGDAVYNAKDIGYTGQANAVTVTDKVTDYLKEVHLKYPWVKSKDTITIDTKTFTLWSTSSSDLLDHQQT